MEVRLLALRLIPSGIQISDPCIIACHAGRFRSQDAAQVCLRDLLFSVPGIRTPDALAASCFDQFNRLYLRARRGIEQSVETPNEE